MNSSRFAKTCAAAAVAISLLFAACGGSGSPGVAFDTLKLQAEGTSFDRNYGSPAELSEVIRSNHESRGGTEMVLRGRIVDVERGISFAWEMDETSVRRVDLPYGDERAETNTVHLTVEATEILSPHAEERSSVRTVGLLFDPAVSFEDIEKDFKGLGELVLFLETSGAFDYQPGTYSVMENSLLFGVLDDNGTIDFPLLDKEDPLRASKASIADVRVDG